MTESLYNAILEQMFADQSLDQYLDGNAKQKLKKALSSSGLPSKTELIALLQEDVG
jgi:hypothetical protein